MCNFRQYLKNFDFKIQIKDSERLLSIEDKNLEKAYITVLIGENYLDGVRVLKESLSRTLPKYPFYVLVPNDINKELIKELEKSRINVLRTRPFGNEIMEKKNKVDYWKNTLFKLKIFDLTKFEKIIFLDSDMIVFKNLDELFLLPHMSAVAAGRELHENWTRLNSGLMVIEPNHDEYLKLVSIIDQVFAERQKQGLGVGDQDIINAYYQEWVNMKELQLNSVYNIMLGYAGYLKKVGIIKSFSDIYVYHFTGKEKPWRNNLRENFVIILKILKRSKSKLDFLAFKRYKEILRSLKSNK